MRQVAVLGATGSIGASTLEVIARHPERFRVAALSAHRDCATLVDLCTRFVPDVAVIADASLHDEFAAALRSRGLRTEALAGADALDDIAADTRFDTVVAAIVGAAGLASTLAAARAGKRLLLANKEAVVMSGELLVATAARNGATIIPLDSEHNAIFQCLPRDYAHNPGANGITRLILTASGGPFRGWSREQLRGVTPDQACAHPRWKMGRKISIDSATLMNKGLEVIEAQRLFGVAPEHIDVLVHPQSIVHSLVEYADGSQLAQLGSPDMRTPIANALAWPARIDAGVTRLDLVAAARLDFEAPDLIAFPCLAHAFAALRTGGAAPIMLNAANEVAVAAFLAGRIGFLDIERVISSGLQRSVNAATDTLEAIVAIDYDARRAAECDLQGFSS
ncbi:MAG TPA: 1-deoxy-D-xylulose-5-phosphate reductoisomerase [Pseudomonadota bacterium]|nr:1-deoxy-D-xylulose-5-phosphate reductoisomerase [Rhodanobacteraceae bacterium]MBP9155614.1 1-deoxy-D-xylulose-5-phosphate reductoisomerase [Xanthomonadales bacterium]HQW80494.1 1-deoxy-D-xylulose-5-phosphate reductoisomerase [Pseudomonadota bacterium]